MGRDFHLFKLEPKTQMTDKAELGCNTRDHVYVEVCELIDLLSGQQGMGKSLWIRVDNDFDLEIDNGESVSLPNYGDKWLEFGEVLEIQKIKSKESWDNIKAHKLLERFSSIKREELYYIVSQSAKRNRNLVYYLLKKDFNNSTWFELFKEQFTEILNTIKEEYVFYYAE